MISAGEFPKIGKCDTPKCVAIQDKLNDGCSVAADNLKKDFVAARSRYDKFLGSVAIEDDAGNPVEVKGGTSPDALISQQAFENTCSDFFMDKKTLPGKTMLAYAPIYEDAGMTDADFLTLAREMKGKTAKTADECGRDEKIPDGRDGCMSCPPGTEYDSPNVCKDEEKKAESRNKIRINGGLGIPGQADDTAMSGATGDFGKSVNGGSGASDSALGLKAEAGYGIDVRQPSGSDDTIAGTYLWLSLLFYGTIFSAIEDNGDREKGVHMNSFLGPQLSLSNAWMLGKDSPHYIEAGAGTFIGWQRLNFVDPEFGHVTNDGEDDDANRFAWGGSLRLSYLYRTEPGSAFEAGVELLTTFDELTGMDRKYPNSEATNKVDGQLRQIDFTLGFRF